MSKFSELKTKLKKIFTFIDNNGDLDMLKIEDVNIAEEEDVLYGQYSKYNKKPMRGEYRGAQRACYYRGSRRGYSTGKGSSFGNGSFRGKSVNKFDKQLNEVQCSFRKSILSLDL